MEMEGSASAVERGLALVYEHFCRKGALTAAAETRKFPGIFSNFMRVLVCVNRSERQRYAKCAPKCYLRRKRRNRIV